MEPQTNRNQNALNSLRFPHLITNAWLNVRLEMPMGSTALTKSIWFIRDNAVQQLHRLGSRLQPVPGWATHTMSESINITAVLLSAVHTRSCRTVFSARPHDCWFELFSSCRCSLRWGRRLQTQARDRELVGTWHTTDISAPRQRNIVHAIATQNHQEAAGDAFTWITRRKIAHPNSSRVDCW